MEVTLEEVIRECLQENIEVTFCNEGSGITVKCRILGPVNYGASAHGTRPLLVRTAQRAKWELKKSLGAKEEGWEQPYDDSVNVI